jgi:hypothetical protein
VELQGALYETFIDTFNYPVLACASSRIGFRQHRGGAVLALSSQAGKTNLFFVSLALVGLGIFQENAKDKKVEEGYARIQSLDREGDKITLSIDSKEKVTVPVREAQLKTATGQTAKLDDFKEGQFVKYSWNKKDEVRSNIRLAQTFCKADGPTLCETESNREHCHHKCKDGPCACPP